jgi:hypothetical protein
MQTIFSSSLQLYFVEIERITKMHAKHGNWNTRVPQAKAMMMMSPTAKWAKQWT